MRATIRNYIDALKQRREEHGEEGFSLIELIVVVVILGILAAIAIPIFLNIQADAQKNAIKTVAANGATQVAAALAKGTSTSPGAVDLSNLATDGTTIAAGGTSLDDYCVIATNGSNTAASGPGAASDTACKTGSAPAS